MMSIRDFIIRALKNGFRFVTRKKFYPPECDCDRQSANDKIYNLLASGKPCMIARYGTTELNGINNYLCVQRDRNFWLKCLDYITDCTHTPWWNEKHFHTMSVYSGIYPETRETAEKLSKRYLSDTPEIDIIGSHQYYEKFMPLRPDVCRVQLEMLYPFFVERPWTRILKGKRVLVIHPFEATIRAQYAKRKQLFCNEDILPEFELITLKAVQSLAGNKSQFDSWFDALDYMEEQISHLEFDVALIGCGAYGLPLAAYIKRLGKQAVHLGGGLQLFFGILGNRWVEQYPQIGIWHYRPGVDISLDYTSLFNDNWIYPFPEDTLLDANVIENACYWRSENESVKKVHTT